MTEPTEVRELLALIDRLEGLLDRSELSEIEVEAGGTALVLRRPSAVAPFDVDALRAAISAGGARTASVSPTSAASGASADSLPETTDGRIGLHAVVAPLTGVYYGSPSPGAAPYVKEGGPVSAGQVIGLIEAMKLFNEIKSDINGTVRHIAAETGALVKAKQPLIEVEPS